MDVKVASGPEDDGIRVVQCGFVRRTYYKASLFEVDFVHYTYNFINFARMGLE